MQEIDSLTISVPDISSRAAIVCIEGCLREAKAVIQDGGDLNKLRLSYEVTTSALDVFSKAVSQLLKDLEHGSKD